MSTHVPAVRIEYRRAMIRDCSPIAVTVVARSATPRHGLPGLPRGRTICTPITSRRRTLPDAAVAPGQQAPPVSQADADVGRHVAESLERITADRRPDRLSPGDAGEASRGQRRVVGGSLDDEVLLAAGRTPGAAAPQRRRHAGGGSTRYRRRRPIVT